MNTINQGITVLSLFDGISCGMVALERAGIKVNKYYASEIEPNAIKISKKNYPNIIQLGDIRDIDEETLNKLGKIDLVIGGSPCQGFSIAGKKLNFNDNRSKLFFEYYRILKYLKNKNSELKFLFENVKMPDKISSIIDEMLDVKHKYIDSKNFTGMIRKRFYWCNFNVANIQEKELRIKDVIDNLPYDRDINFYLNRTNYNPKTSRDGIITINPRDNNGKQTWQRGRIYDINGNLPTICATLFDLNITNDHKKYRKLTIEECEKLQGLPRGYTYGVNTNERGKLLGNGWTVDVIAHILKGIDND